MHIHLKRGEKIYVNGAVLRLDRRASLEFLNDVDFLLEAHVMQPEQASTPLRQLYFVAQAMLIDPSNAGITFELYKNVSENLCEGLDCRRLKVGLSAAGASAADGRYFETLKQLRALFEREAEILNRKETTTCN